MPYDADAARRVIVIRILAEPKSSPLRGSLRLSAPLRGFQAYEHHSAN
jgi:hypothetical protein